MILHLLSCFNIFWTNKVKVIEGIKFTLDDFILLCDITLYNIAQALVVLIIVLNLS